MMNRIEQKFAELKRGKQKAFLAYLTAGFPNLNITEKLAVSFERNGVDILELGIPFSDPLADGPTIQASSQYALKGKVTLEKIFQTVARIRRKSQIPIALMTYYNPVYHYGEARFIKRAREVGVDGLIIPDLPPEEAKDLIKAARKQQLATVFFIAPTTKKERIKRIIQSCSGFIYYVSVTGVTGARKTLPKDLLSHVRQIKRQTNNPVCVGFGISAPSQIKNILKVSDGVIVGSAIIKIIEKNIGKAVLVKNVNQFIRTLSKTVH